MLESLQRRIEEDTQLIFVAQVYHPSHWDRVQDDLLRLTQLGMDESVITDDDVNEWARIHFQKEDPDMINVLLMKERRAIGLSTAYRYPNPRLAIISHTIIAPEERNKGRVGILNRYMDDVLRQRGIREVERYALSKDGYDSTLARAYKNRIVDSKAYPSSTYFKIRL